MNTMVLSLLVALLSFDSVSYAAYTRMPGQSASDAALSSMVGHMGMWLIFGLLYLVYRFIKDMFNKK